MDIKLGFLGFGNIGTGVYKIIESNGAEIAKRQGINLTVGKVLVRDTGKKRSVTLEPGLLTSDIRDIVDDPGISIVAEYMGGIDPARDYVIAALEKGKTVVTANKELIARCWPELEKAARASGAGLYYEASVAGGIPVIKVMGESLQANNVYEVMGIINGTTNYILTKMSEDGRSFSEVLAEAQQLGYAEPDPTSDIEGHDAMYKLSILSSIAFHKRVSLENIYREGITNITVDDISYGRELGFVLRLLAIAKKNGSVIEARIHPTFIPESHPLAAVRGSFNAVFIKGDAVGNLMLYGRGAGDLPTGSAIISDIVTACKHIDRKHSYTTFNSEEGHNSFQEQEVSFNDNWETEYFIHLSVKDKPGVLAKIAGILGNYGVSIASVIQKGHNIDQVPLIFVTHGAREKSLQKAVEEIKQVEDVIKVVNLIRVEQ